MALPASLSTCTVVGTYVNLLGNPVSGSINFTPQTILKEVAANVIIIPSVIQKTFDATGSFSIVLPVTSDTDVSPQPFIYTIEENFTSGRTIQISLPISVAGTTQNLADLLPALSSAEAASIVTVDAYQALLTRYNNAESIRVLVVDADEKADDANTYATAAASAANSLNRYNANQFMTMGI
jgi:hypothetical protein